MPLALMQIIRAAIRNRGAVNRRSLAWLVCQIAGSSLGVGSLGGLIQLNCGELPMRDAEQAKIPPVVSGFKRGLMRGPGRFGRDLQCKIVSVGRDGCRGFSPCVSIRLAGYPTTLSLGWC